MKWGDYQLNILKKEQKWIFKFWSKDILIIWKILLGINFQIINFFMCYDSIKDS